MIVDGFWETLIHRSEDEKAEFLQIGIAEHPVQGGSLRLDNRTTSFANIESNC
jgi:hypothetical protein